MNSRDTSHNYRELHILQAAQCTTVVVYGGVQWYKDYTHHSPTYTDRQKKFDKTEQKIQRVSGDLTRVEGTTTFTIQPPREDYYS